jgi:hypothetical protein
VKLFVQSILPAVGAAGPTLRSGKHPLARFISKTVASFF